MPHIELPTKEICKNCKFFNVFEGRAGTASVDVNTGKSVRAGIRSCYPGSVAWEDSPCVTGQFKPKEPQGRVVHGIGGTLCQPKEKG